MGDPYTTTREKEVVSSVRVTKRSNIVLVNTNAVGSIDGIHTETRHWLPG